MKLLFLPITTKWYRKLPLKRRAMHKHKPKCPTWAIHRYISPPPPTLIRIQLHQRRILPHHALALSRFPLPSTRLPRPAKNNTNTSARTIHLMALHAPPISSRSHGSRKIAIPIHLAAGIVQSGCRSSPVAGGWFCGRAEVEAGAARELVFVAAFSHVVEENPRGCGAGGGDAAYHSADNGACM